MSKKLIFVAALPLLLVVSDGASAVSQRVREACRSDYRAYCSAYEVGSSELRACMRSVKHKLSKRCLRSLVDEGEATEADIRAYKSRK